MLYPTHKRFGILWGLLAFPVGVFLGIIPVFSTEMTSLELFMVIMCSYLGIRGSLFGAEFPDIDSPTSIPRKKHPIIGRVFDAFGVQHRGKYSHDFFSIGLTFGIIYLIISFTGENLIQKVAQGNNFLAKFSYASMIIFVWVVANSMVDVILWFANVTKNKKMWAIVNSRRIIYGIAIGLVLFFILSFSGVAQIKPLITGVTVSQALPCAMILVSSFKIYVIFSLIGAYSHLFADMITKQGVSIFFIRLSPMGVVSKVRKIPVVGKFLVPLDPKTGGKWEDLVRTVVTVACIPASFIASKIVLGF